ncbi:hypothetical protein BZG02_08310 [Labilibaculum filiforme]|uniref:DUF5723 domain-containing protein n=1 Tax=Labilibaculum filiforme TaxID=1940526 RepID=A0A2N3HZ78_9BACT|nr:DUF5723 family protein [Labilibaculum filiforme]PKQ63379.1 hypothetical protein BZG02_08310 [Labilibaculum filiforme]
MTKLVTNISLTGILILFLSLSVAAQKMNNTLYLMQNVPQSNQLNPAIQPECKVFVGFPALSSIYLNYSNSSFGYNDIIKDGTGIQKDSLVVDVNSFHDALQTTNFVSQQFELTLFALGIRAKEYFFTLDVIEKQDTRFSFDQEMLTFLKNGNYDYRGRTSNWGGLGMDASYYHEIALGVSKKINDKWTVGVKGKMLFGIANLHMQDSKMSVFTSATGDEIRLNSEHRLRVSMPINQIGIDSDGYVDDIDIDGDDYDADFFANTDNKGFAIDLGMTYQMDEKTRLYASILDIGTIKWKTDGHEFSQNGSFTWTGADWSQSGNSKDPNYREIEDVFEDLTDSIADEFRVSNNINSYSVALPTKIYIGGTHDLNKRVNVGALSRTEIFNGKIQSSLTFSANARFFRNLSTSLSYSLVNNSYNNIGFGLATKLGPTQFYVVSDNVMAAIKPNTAHLANIRFGINLLFGCKDKTKRKDSCSFEDEIKNKKKPLYK